MSEVICPECGFNEAYRHKHGCTRYAALRPDPILHRLAESEARVRELERALERIKDGGLPHGVLGNVVERMLAMCEIAGKALAPTEPKESGNG